MPKNNFVINKFGNNPDIDTGSVPEVVWSGGGTYSFQASAVTLEALSSSANDTAAGTGARTFKIMGLDENFNNQSEIITLNGTTPVTLTNQYTRVFRAQIETAGSGQINAGDITVRLPGPGATQLIIPANEGQTLMAIFTVPRGQTGVIRKIWSTFADDNFLTTSTATLRMRISKNGVIKTKYNWTMGANVPFEYFFELGGIDVEEETDIYIEVTDVSDNDSDINAGFDIVLERKAGS